jgi:hypothetical protein
VVCSAGRDPASELRETEARPRGSRTIRKKDAARLERRDCVQARPSRPVEGKRGRATNRPGTRLPLGASAATVFAQTWNSAGGRYPARAIGNYWLKGVIIHKQANRNLLANLNPLIDFKRYYFPENFAASATQP